MTKLKAIFLVGTLKKDSEVSNTFILSQFLAKHLSAHETESEIIRLADYDIHPGVYTNIDSDDWPVIFEKVLAADIIIFATPVWWGIQSSLIQRVIERLDELHDEIMDTGRSKLTNKVAGIIITGDSDGAEHIIGNLANFFSSLGFTFPPFGALTVLWSGLKKKSDKSKQEISKYFEDSYTSTAKKAAQNLTFMADLLKKNPFPD
ncbi:MAG: NAD(P)H-dependent oxidoreductase [Nitrosopumilus sp.]|nr:NAD(P)H-dependent oxidoreductase [Nitrosopumilus sp.]